MYFFICLILYYHPQLCRKSVHIEEQKILEIQAKEYSQLSQHVQETREIRHDFRHQITVISGLLNQGNYEELKEYLSQYESSISLQTKIYCRQPAVNAILSHYDLLCAQDKIKTKFAVDFPTLSPISSVDFCIVLGNLLENAYLECKTLQKYEKFIHLKARQTSPGAFVLLIENPYEHEIKKQTVASSYPLAAKTASVQVLNQSLPYVKNTMAICLLRLITTALKSRCFYNVNSID